jgi:hypothetical protein
MSTEAIKTRTYGNWRRPRKAGLGSFGLVGTVGVFGGLILVLLASMISMQAALVIAVPIVAVVGPAGDPHPGRPQRLQRDGAARRMARAASPSGSTSTCQGRCRPVPGGRFRPPGMLSKVTMLEGRDPYDRPFGVLHHRYRNLYTVVLGCEPDGGSLVDPRPGGHLGGDVGRLAVPARPRAGPARLLR